MLLIEKKNTEILGQESKFNSFHFNGAGLKPAIACQSNPVKDSIEHE